MKYPITASQPQLWSRVTRKALYAPDLSESETESESFKDNEKRTATSKEIAKDEGIIPDSVGFGISEIVADIERDVRTKSLVEQDVIPESMEIEDDYTTPMSLSRNNSQTAVNEENRMSASLKRRRVTEDNSDTDKQKLSNKRIIMSWMLMDMNWVKMDSMMDRATILNILRTVR